MGGEGKCSRNVGQEDDKCDSRENEQKRKERGNEKALYQNNQQINDGSNKMMEQQ